MSSFRAFLQGGPAPNPPAHRTTVIAAFAPYVCRRCDVYFNVKAGDTPTCWCCGTGTRCDTRITPRVKGTS